jgi:hypothetical protein
VKTVTLTDRQAELIEVALESAISACAGFAHLDGEDDLSRQYANALEAVRGAS